MNRKLDEQVADQVMGYFVIREGLPENVPVGCVLTSEVWQQYYVKYRHRHKDLRELVKLNVGYYSTDLKYSVQVIQRMISLGYNYEAKCEEGKHYWRFTRQASTSTQEHVEPSEWICREKMEEAICLAALKAIQTEIWERTI